MTLRVADENGALRTVQRAWVFDGSAWKSAVCAWVSPPTGAMKKDVDCVGSMSASAVALDHLNIKATWSAPGATTVSIFRGGIEVLRSNAPTGQFAITGNTPGSTVVIIIRAISPNNTVESPPITVVMPGMPQPTGLTHSNFTNTSYDIAWDSMIGASSYDVYNAANNAKLHSTTGTSWARTGLTPSTTYQVYTKSLHASGAASPASGILTSSTTARFTPGTYEFWAGSCDTWQGSAGTWRGTGEGKVWHGDGGYFGASGGSRYGFFFGHNRYGQSIPTFFASQGAVDVNVTKVEFYAHRSSTAHGIYSAQTCRWHMHNHASRPTSPSLSTGPYDSGSLALGGSGWFTMPLSWGVALVTDPAHHKGIVWGGWPYASNGAGYMYGPTLSGDPVMGAIKITVS